MKNNIIISNKCGNWTLQPGKLYLVTYRGKNHERPGINKAVAWIKMGQRPHTLLLVHSCWEDWDRISHEYTSKWEIYDSSIIDIKQVKTI